MQTIHISSDFPLNRRLRKAVKRGQLQVVRAGGKLLTTGRTAAPEPPRGLPAFSSSLLCRADHGAKAGGVGGGAGDGVLTEDQQRAVDAFVADFQKRAGMLPGKVAACGALFSIGAHAGLGLKVLLLAPPGSGKTALCDDWVCPLVEAQGNFLVGTSPKRLRRDLEWMVEDDCRIFVHGHAAVLQRGCLSVLAKWNGSVLLCEVAAEARGWPAAFLRVKVDQKEAPRAEGAPVHAPALSLAPPHADSDTGGVGASSSEDEDAHVRPLRPPLRAFLNFDGAALKHFLIQKLAAL